MTSEPLLIKKPNYSQNEDLPDFDGLNQKKEAVFFIAPQPFFTNRGTPLNVKAILECLSSQGIEVTLLTYPLGEDISLPGLKIIRSPSVPGIEAVPVGISLQKLILDFFLFFTAFRYVWSGKYKVLHGIEEGALILSFLKLISGPKAKSARLIYDMDSSMGGQFQESKSLLLRLFAPLFSLTEKFFLKRADVVLTVCEALSKEAEKSVNKDKIVQIEDFSQDENVKVEETEVLSLKDELGLDAQKIIVYTGNFHSSQGIEMLLEAYALTLKSFSKGELKLVLVGGGAKGDKTFDSISAYIEKLKISEDVILTGNRPLPQMPVFYSLADILVSPRIKGSNTPLKIYSYMSAKKPIVATDIYSHTQVLSKESAFLGEANSESFSEEIIKALSSEVDSLKRAKEASCLIDEKYNRDVFNKKLIATYKDIYQK